MLNNNNDAPSTLQHYRGLTADDQHGGGLIIPPHNRKSSILGDNLSIASHLQSKPSLRRLSSDDHHSGITIPQRARHRMSLTKIVQVLKYLLLQRLLEKGFLDRLPADVNSS
jgi:hypothetical protein